MIYSQRLASDKSYSSWTEDDPGLLEDVVDQPIDFDACWAIPTTRQLGALFKLSDLLPYDSCLSVQETIDIMPRTKLVGSTHRIRKIYDLGDPLLNIGTVLEYQNPLTFNYLHRLKKVKNTAGRFKAKQVVFHKYQNEGFDRSLLNCLKKSPVTARLALVGDYYSGIEGRALYNPLDDEEKENAGHLILLTGVGVNEDDKRFFEAQDSYGLSKGHQGFIRIADNDLLTDFIEMSV